MVDATTGSTPDDPLIAVLTRIAEAVEVIADQLQTPPTRNPRAHANGNDVAPLVIERPPEPRQPQPLAANQMFCPECGGIKPRDTYARCFQCNVRRKEALSDCPRCGSEKSTDLTKYSQCWPCTQAIKEAAVKAAADPKPF